VTKQRSFTLLAHDPGSKNYGYAVLEVTATALPLTKKSQQMAKLKVKLLEVSKVKSQFSTLKDASLATKEMQSYRRELRRVIRDHRPVVQIAERYMSRRMGGVTIELVNQMIGVLRVEAEAARTPIKLIPASQWKNELKRNGVDLDVLYKLAKTFKRSPHETDATMIGLYGAFVLMRCKPFAYDKLSKLTKDLVTSMKDLKEAT
jgi:Holliday junction resolvasome RuvABC endonuclease subunit